MLLTRPPLDGKSKSKIVQALNFHWAISFDLHVLGMPPAFILSQDQTLKIYIFYVCFFPSYSNNLDVLLSFQRSFSPLLYKGFLRFFLSSAIKIYHIRMTMSTTFFIFFNFFYLFLQKVNFCLFFLIKTMFYHDHFYLIYAIYLFLLPFKSINFSKYFSAICLSKGPSTFLYNFIRFFNSCFTIISISFG